MQLSIIYVWIAACLILLIAWTTGPFYYHFASLRLVTVYSFIQLIAASVVSFLACKILEKKNSLEWRKNPSARPFFISAIGFLFLAFDEIFSLHENIDKAVHYLLFLEETMWTDHIDDFIVLLYGLIAVFFVKDFIREFKRHPYMVRLILWGLAAFFIMVILDFISNNTETFNLFFFKNMSYGDLKHRQDIFRMAEDSVKLLGEALLLSAFAAAFIHINRRKNMPNN